MSKARKGKKLTEDHKAKLSKVRKMTGPLSDETKAKMSATMKTRPRKVKGSGSDETKAKIRANMKKKRASNAVTTALD